MKRAFSFFAIIISLMGSLQATEINPSLVGKWKIESIQATADEPVQTCGAFSRGSEIIFGADGTLCKSLMANDKRNYYYDTRLGEIIIQEGHTYGRYAVTYLANGYLRLVSEEGVTLLLTR